MLRAVMERSREVGKTVDVVKHILAIAERERRKRALKEQPGQTQPVQTTLGKDGGRELGSHLYPVKRSTGFR
jgi:hypothetical protein